MNTSPDIQREPKSLARAIATHGLAVLAGAIVASYFAFNLASAHTQMQDATASQRVAAVQAQADSFKDSSEVLAAKYRACVDQVKNFTEAETVLYEPQAPSLSVFHNAISIAPGKAITGAGGVGALKPRWIIGARIVPVSAAENLGAAYSYIDKRTGELSGPFAAASHP